MRKYVELKSNFGDATRAATVLAALISENDSGRNQFCVSSRFNYTVVRTRLAGDKLAYLAVLRAVRLREKRRESRDGDVVLEEIELRDAVPDLCFRSELRTPISPRHLAWTLTRTMLKMKTFGFIG
jgi:hypothetical protein